MKHDFKSFWYGKKLSPYEELCLRSFIENGHSFSLYTYDELSVPEGVKLRDARTILPKEDVFFYKSDRGKGSVAAFANRFRYALLYKLGGWWVDMDMVCLSDDIPHDDFFFAYENTDTINNAMLHFPPEHAAMRHCFEQATARGQHIQWGETGPKLITSVLEELNMLGFASSAKSCYPIEWTNCLQLFDPKFKSKVADAARESIAVHLWNEVMRRSGVNKTEGTTAGIISG